MGEPTYVSAKHNEGMADLYKTLQPKIDKINQSEKIYNIVDAFDLNKFSQMVKEKDPLLKSDKNKSLQFAIIGRPNVGKSTLANAILKNSDISEQRTEFSREDRVVTSPVPGTTRDSISINLVFRNRFFKLIDTAGLVGPGRMSWKSLEREVSASMDDTLKSVQFANVVCLVLNIGENTIAQLRKIEKINKNDIAKAIFSKKDHSIANKILEEGRSLLLAINKIDKIPNLKKIPTAEKIVKQTKDFVVEKMKSFAGRIDVVGISAKQNLNICQLLDNVLAIYFRLNFYHWLNFYTNFRN
ncbi:hypothetical protein MHBO_001822 [Bonamia ostreae]|uniref:G domain-containing protein n=1 Tax=Bonamia ostreae TaxID=126728 RepID=A0ABV2AKA8_9EUKA